MNSLALAPEGVLLHRDFMLDHNMIVGDTILVGAARYGLRAEMQMQIVGDFRYFPTWYPEADGPLVVGNLDHLFERMGGQFPYDVLVRTDPGTDYDGLARELRQYDINVINHYRRGSGLRMNRKSRSDRAVRRSFGRLSGGGTIDRAGIPAVHAVLIPAPLY